MTQFEEQREEKLGNLLLLEISNEEEKWVKYSDDIDRVKFFLAEDIFETIIEETVNLLN